MRKLPIGIQTFSEIIEENYVYVDKTKWILDLLNAGKYLFFARPRRFGKSLLISTLDSIFRGRKHLFSGLYIEDKIEWKEYPVIRLDLSTCQTDSPQNLEISLKESLQVIAENYSVSLESPLVSGQLRELIRKLSARGRVVILIDEYDKPIVDRLTDLELAGKMRDVLKNFYSVLKGSDEYIKSVFITGVSKFSQVSIFSGLNNITDISFFPEFSSLLGYTQEELESCFSDRMSYLKNRTGMNEQEILNKMKFWYNGYSWDGTTRVYNPFSVLNFFNTGEFHNFWFQTGTPTFLIRHIKAEKISVPSMENIEASPETFESSGIEETSFHSLLFQTGYLTVREIRIRNNEKRYILDYPNEEVKRSFFVHILNSFLDGKKSVGQVSPIVQDMNSDLRNNDLNSFILRLRSIFASIPYTLHIDSEAYYHSLFYMILKLIGCRIDLEVLSSEGRADGILEFSDRIYVIELKLDSPEKAIEQIHKKGYHNPYLSSGKKIYLLGIGYLNRTTEFILEEI
ncbi:MAG TPA: AAA family ATPase [Leptospiraceae bacterium]|nr:AAA family ATPase [Leptospiraceae bacterium]HMY67276.1 AAA family ATPase [Leptospiraceae bacterium]HNH09092.1 AAA family ATPase [Leptospiraceae bacterium]HNI99197.1 AAA family ATPase [Leptospiraceae bacterium]HNN06925.1 AAA family ATPase [Leptospiraceae bacterium]